MRTSPTRPAREDPHALGLEMAEEGREEGLQPEDPFQRGVSRAGLGVSAPALRAERAVAHLLLSADVRVLLPPGRPGVPAAAVPGLEGAGGGPGGARDW